MRDDHEQERIAAEIGRQFSGADPFAAAVRATRMPMIITDPRLPDNPIVFVNNSFCKLTGYVREEILGRNCRFLQGPATHAEDVAKVRDAVDRRVPIEIDLCNHRKDGTTFWNRLLISPVFDDDGALTYFFASQFDVTLERERLVRLQQDRDTLEREAEQRAADLSRSEERLRFTLKAGRLGSWTLDLTSMRLMASEECKRNFGRDPAEPFSYDQLMETIHADDRARKQRASDTAIAQQTDYDIEYRVVMPHGEVRWLHVRGRPFYRGDGTPLSMVGITFDITDRKRAEEHRDLLARELSHRIKNTLATVQSIARQTLREAECVKAAQTALEARIQSLAAANDLLTREGGETATLAEVVTSALRPFGVDQVQRFKIGGPSLRLSSRVALAFALALHELATNSVKYGALSWDAGSVLVSWDIVDEAGPSRLTFRWQELDGPRVLPPTRTGFGTRMIERALAQETGGTARIHYRPRGVEFVAEAELAGILHV